MNVITTADPWRLVHRLHAEAGRLHAAWPNGAAQTVSDWVPAVDVAEEVERYVIRADLPGVAKEDLDIVLEKGVLTIQGRRETRGQDGASWRRAERVSGRFHRRFSLPESADAEAVAAEYRDGVLVVSVAKRAQAQPRRIEVRAS